MSKYRDVTSYNLAVKIRSHKTILVEGPTDKSVISSFFLQRNYETGDSDRFVVDDISIISNDPELAGLGNRERVLAVAGRLKTNSKLGYLVDREWDEINFQNLNELSPVPTTSNTFITQGHSIENYWFQSSAAISFLQQAFPASINADFLRDVEQHFPKIILFAAAFSIAAKQGEVIQRTDDLLTYSDIIVDANSLMLNPEFNLKLQERRSNFDIVSAFNEQAAILNSESHEKLRWVCHGHLGEQAIRACIASLAVKNSVNIIAVNEIERGDKTGKFKHDAKFIASCSRAETHPLDELLGWIKSTQ